MKDSLKMAGILDQFDFNSQFTPDAVDLESKVRVPLFVYNELKQGHPFHNILEQEGADFQQVCFTVDKCYRMWLERRTALPVVLDEPDPKWKPGYIPAHVKGELYYVEGGAFMGIDKYMKNTVQYKRVSTRLVLPVIRRVGSYPEGTVKDETRSHLRHAYIYVGIRDYWDPIIDWHSYKLLEPKMDRLVKQYYSFEPSEYEDS